MVMKKNFMMICCVVLIMLMVTSCADARKQRVLSTPVEGVLENGVRYEFIVEEFDLNEFLENNPIYVANSLLIYRRTVHTPSEVAARIGLHHSFPSFVSLPDRRDVDQYSISIRFCTSTDSWVLFIKPFDADMVVYGEDCSIIRMITIGYTDGSINRFYFRVNCQYELVYSEEFRQQVLSTSVEGVLENGVRYQFVGGEFNLGEFFERNTGIGGRPIFIEPVIVRTPSEAAELGLYFLSREDRLKPYFDKIRLHIRFCSTTNAWVVIFNYVDIRDIIDEDSIFNYIPTIVVTFNYSTGETMRYLACRFTPREIIW